MQRKIKDITEEEAIIIAKLAYGFDKYIKGKLEFKYQPHDKDFYEDSREYVRIEFNACLMADTFTTMIVEISPNLNVSIDYICPRKNRRKSFPLRNQYQIQKNFMKWGIIPYE